MRSPAVAMAWEFRQQHRWGLVAIGVYVLGLTAIELLFVESLWGTEVGDLRFAFTVTVPLTAAAFYLVTMFSFGFNGDLAARGSMYPRRMFALPVTTTSLVWWPMLFGTVAIGTLWLVTVPILNDHATVEVPTVWPAIYLAVFLAWTQVAMWTQYPVVGLRVVAAVVLLMLNNLAGILALEVKPPEALMVVVFAPQLPLAFLAARAAVARARRGDDVDWRRARAPSESQTVARRPFESGGRAQVWFEWRQHGRALPTWVAILLPFELALLFLAGKTPAFVFVTIFAVAITPPCLAAFVAATSRKANPQSSDPYGVPTFLATRPMTNAALIAAKLKVAAWSTIAAWMVVIVAVPLALMLSGQWQMVVDRVRQVSNVVGAPRVSAVLLLGLALLVSTTWKRLVSSLYVGLSGRRWLINTYIGLTLAFLVAVVPLLDWYLGDSAVRLALWDWMPAIVASLVAIKMSAAAWVLTRLHHDQLLGERALLLGAAGWVVAVFVLYALMAWIVASPHVPHYFLVLLAILAIPLTRLAAAPMALAWNRHR